MNEEAWFGLYRLFRAIGMPRVTVPVEVKKGSHTYTLPVGWPELKIAITLDSNDGRKFKQEGWQVVYIPANALTAAEPIVTLLDELVRKRTVADSFAEAQMTVSKTENKLLEALLRAGLPEPDRNFKFLDQHRTTITIPDFVWEEPKVAVFVDGEFFHGLKDLGDSLQALLAADPDLKSEFTDQAKDTMAKDAAKRRKLTKAGWKVIVVTASEIDTGELGGIVNDIVTAVRQAPRYVPAEDTGVEADDGNGWVLVVDDEDSPDGEDVPTPVTLSPPEPAGPKYDLPPPGTDLDGTAADDLDDGWEDDFDEEPGGPDTPEPPFPSWLKREAVEEPVGKPYDLPPPT